uniref:Uncharacterized protein n=1 Tax=Aegilops tauschii subsp. strangulata TaxID=200361 RepID=A0A453N6R5_AEGTS
MTFSVIIFSPLSCAAKPAFPALAETIRGFQLILSGELDGLPEQAFYLVGNLDEASESKDAIYRRGRCVCWFLLIVSTSESDVFLVFPNDRNDVSGKVTF